MQKKQMLKKFSNLRSQLKDIQNPIILTKIKLNENALKILFANLLSTVYYIF